MKTPIEIINKMVDEMPYSLGKSIIPYIKEALEIFGEQCFNAKGEMHEVEREGFFTRREPKYKDFQDYLNKLNNA